MTVGSRITLRKECKMRNTVFRYAALKGRQRRIYNCLMFRYFCIARSLKVFVHMVEALMCARGTCYMNDARA